MTQDRHQTITTLFVIVLVALVVRLIGINFGFPFILHPDEPTIISSATGVRWNINPGHFDWPHLYIYLNFLLYTGFALARRALEVIALKDFLLQSAPILWDDALIYPLLTRIFTATLGALTAIPVYLTSKKLFGEQAGFFAAITMAILPFHVHHSHYALADVPMVFFLAWSMYYSILVWENGRTKDFILAGLFCGLSASTKYNGLLICLMVPLAVLLSGRDIKNSVLNTVYSGIAAVVSFFLGTPFALLDMDTFLRTDGPKGALWQFKNVGSVELPERIEHLSDAIFSKVAENTGYVVMYLFLALCFLLVVRLILRKTSVVDKKLYLLCIPAMAFLYYVSGLEKNRAHYYMISYPPMVAAFSFVFYRIINFLNSKIRNLGAVFFVLIMVTIGFYTMRVVERFYVNDKRVYLYRWLRDNADRTMPVVYTSNSLKDIFIKLNLSFYKGSGYISRFPTGYLVLYGEEEQYIFRRPYSMFEEIYSDTSPIRPGDDIKVVQYTL